MPESTTTSAAGTTGSEVSHGATITRERLIRDLERLGIQPGDHLGLGISFRSIGSVAGGPDTLINALLEAVGPDGTIMIPAFTPLFPRTITASGRVERVFDPAWTPAYTGIVSETLRQRRGALRSRHPVCSVIADGQLARQLTEGHDADAPACLPYSRLADCGGKVLCIGIGDNLVAFRHQAQYLAGLLDVVPFRRRSRVRDEAGRIRTYVRRDESGCVRKLPDLVAVLRERGLVANGKIGEADAVLVQAREGLRVMTEILRDAPVRNLCGVWSCLWCRELERRLDLYGAIKNPRFFQRHRAVAWLTGLVNRVRLACANIDRPYTQIFERAIRAPRRLLRWLFSRRSSGSAGN